MAGKRHKGRVLALQILFERDTVGHAPSETFARLAEERPATDEIRSFAEELVTGVLDNMQRIDEVLKERAPSWPLSQVAVTDLNILRLAVYEILIDNKVPMRAAINEAVELAREFGGETSPKFVNGVLGSISLLTTQQTPRR